MRIRCPRAITGISAKKESVYAFARAWKTGKAQKTARISFATPKLPWRVLAAQSGEFKHWAS